MTPGLVPIAPKIKFYYGIKGSSMAEADELFDKVGEAIKKLA